MPVAGHPPHRSERAQFGHCICLPTYGAKCGARPYVAASLRGLLRRAEGRAGRHINSGLQVAQELHQPRLLSPMRARFSRNYRSTSGQCFFYGAKTCHAGRHDFAARVDTGRTEQVCPVPQFHVIAPEPFANYRSGRSSMRTSISRKSVNSYGASRDSRLRRTFRDSILCLTRATSVFCVTCCAASAPVVRM